MMIQRFVAAGVALLILAACGGDDSGDAASPADAETDTGINENADTGAAEPSSAEGAGDGGGTPEEILEGFDFGDGTARVTIGDTAYEFALGGTSTVGGTIYLGVCQELFGMVAGTGYDVDGNDITIVFEIPPPDWESYEDGRFDNSPPRIKIDDNTNGEYWSAEMLLAENFPETAGESQIDDWTVDGDVAFGRATFLPLEPFLAPVEGAESVAGEFEIGCGGSG